MVNALCSVLVEVPLCICMHVIYTFLQGPQWVWTWPAGDTEDIVCWRRMHHILYLLFWIQWGDKCKPIFLLPYGCCISHDCLSRVVWQGQKVLGCTFLLFICKATLCNPFREMTDTLGPASSAWGSFLCTRCFHLPKWRGVGVLSAGALPMSYRPLIQWHFESCAEL